MHDSTQFKIKHLRYLIHDAYDASKTAHDVLFKDSRDIQNQLMSTIFLNKAISLMACAKAIYISDHDNLGNTLVDQIFSTFRIYENEFLTNIRTDHSHQWTDIEFLKYEEFIKSFIE